MMSAVWSDWPALHERGPSLPEGGAVPSLAKIQWDHIQRVLGACGGNVSRSARVLGIARRTLQLKLKKHPPHR